MAILRASSGLAGTPGVPSTTAARLATVDGFRGNGVTHVNIVIRESGNPWAQVLSEKDEQSAWINRYNATS